MKIDFRILVECYADVAFVRSFGIGKKKIVHEKGKSKIGRTLEKALEPKAVAILDEDLGKKSHSFYQKMLPQKEFSNFGIKTFSDVKENYLIIVLSDFLEDWLVKLCRRNKINLKKDFNLPDNPKELHYILNCRKLPDSYFRLLEYLHESKIDEIGKIRESIWEYAK